MAESNNPFIDHSTSVSSRFPAISSSPSPPAPFTSWLQPGGTPTSPTYQSLPQQGFLTTNTTGYIGAPQPPYSPQSPQQYAGQQQQWGGGGGYGQTGSGFVPSSQFGQQAMGQMNAYGSGYPQQQQQGFGFGQQPYGQPPQPQGQPYGGNTYLSQFDPLSPSQSGYPSTPTSNSSFSGSNFGGGAASSTTNGPHPRQFVNTHKSELETWDMVSWKQALNTFEELKRSWEGRKGMMEARIRAMGGTVGGAPGLFGAGPGGAYGGYGYNPQEQEVARLNELVREATSNIDTVAAASFQMSELLNGYRHSADLASKRRVRESCNAALAGLPDWPQQGF